MRFHKIMIFKFKKSLSKRHRERRLGTTYAYIVVVARILAGTFFSQTVVNLKMSVALRLRSTAATPLGVSSA